MPLEQLVDLQQWTVSVVPMLTRHPAKNRDSLAILVVKVRGINTQRGVLSKDDPAAANHQG